MNIFRFELQKLLKQGALWGFLLVCLLFNGLVLLVDADRDSYPNFVGSTAKVTGYVLGEAFDQNLEKLSPADETESYYLAWLDEETSAISDVFDDYDISVMAERYIEVLEIDGSLAESMRNKYLAMQESVDIKAENNESLTLYFAGATYSQHNLLFGNVMHWLLTEGILFSALAMLLSIGFDHIHKTEQVVYSSKTGRHVLRTRSAAAIVIGIGFYLVLTLLTLSINFLVNNFSGIWGSSVSSAFNYLNDLLAGARPFSTWQSFSVLSYLQAVIAASVGLNLCFMLIAFVIGVWQKNSFIGFIIFIVINAMFVLLPFYMPATNYSRYLLVYTPVWLWLKQNMWFTDGGIDILWPNFETVGITISLIVFAICCVLTEYRFRKRDLL